jgi:asparagine synthase (glutamine-hydrolysing)
MCGIAGQLSLTGRPLPDLEASLACQSALIAHRGPDGHGLWTSADRRVGLVHRRLAVIDLSAAATQPMRGQSGAVITYNGEVYNHPELRQRLAAHWDFRSRSDTECILAAYDRHGVDCLDHLRGMFAFAIWDERQRRLFCARDRFGIKPFYYCRLGDLFAFASEAKALVPFLDDIRTNADAFAEYVTFQYTLGEKTLFSGIRQLLPGHALCVDEGRVREWRYWDVQYDIDFDHSPSYFHRRLRELLLETVSLHVRSDVPVGSYVSGGIDSSLIHRLARADEAASGMAFHGRIIDPPGYDESGYARAAVDAAGGDLHCVDITPMDFRDHVARVIYHLDFPVAGPGSFPQYMVSQLASRHVKVVLGGQGGDEIFGGYARYLVAYFEQCIKAAIEGGYQNGNYVVTIESIVPNLGLLREYKPLMKEFWREGLFDPMDARYFRLVNRASDMQDEIAWQHLDMAAVTERFSTIFNNPSNVRREAYFDKMTHFDFKCLLPALLQVEDRMSMAHGVESRVPLLDHPLVEFAATVPADVKFAGGAMKHLVKQTFAAELPPTILARRDKMGFPVPLQEWFAGPLREFIGDTLATMAQRRRPFIHGDAVLRNLGAERRFSRKSWGLLSLELWHQQFHDRAAEWRGMRHASAGGPAAPAAP